MKYQELHGWKYRTVGSTTHTSVIVEAGKTSYPNITMTVITPYGSIRSDGLLTINDGYCWDGGSGPAIDTKNSMLGSLFHDFLYQLMREGKLDRKCRDIADRLLQEILIESGMSKMRAGWWYWAVKSFARRASEPETKPSHEVIEV